MLFNVIEQIFPDGSHRYKYFTYNIETGYTSPSNTSRPSGWTIPRKEKENATRAKNKVYDYARSNIEKWDYFVTLTFDPHIINRQDYTQCYEEVRQLCKRIKSFGGSYLFVPELHNDGCSYHFHGLISDSITLFYSGVYGPSYSKCDVYSIPYFPGFTYVSRIRDSKRVCSYITKYITKDLVHVVPKGRRRYIHSSDLVLPLTERKSMDFTEFAVTACLPALSQFASSDGLLPSDYSFEQMESVCQSARFSKTVPIYYHNFNDFMFIVED